MKIRKLISDVFQTCFRCASIGLPQNGIPPGEEFIEIDGQTACADCWNRLCEEIEGQDGDQWKVA